jgi:hypothetical protein
MEQLLHSFNSLRDSGENRQPKSPDKALTEGNIEAQSGHNQMDDDPRKTFSDIVHLGFYGAPSIHGAWILGIPSLLLNIALGCFLLGLGLYLGFVWTRKLDVQAGVNHSRNVFVFCIVATFLFSGFYYVPKTLKDIGSNRKRIQLHHIQEMEDSLRSKGDESGVAAALGDKLRQARKEFSLKIPSDFEGALKISIKAQEASLEVHKRLLDQISSGSSKV